MTKDKYMELHNIYEIYEGKHAKQWYRVWRVLGPAGPVENVMILGLDEAKEAVRGCWDWEVTNLKGEVMKI